MASKPRSQIEKFKQAARDIGADDSEKRFNERLGKIARQKPGGALLAKKRSPKKAR